MYRIVLSLAGLLLACVAPVLAQDRAEKVRRDKAQIEAAGQWIYNDLAAGLEQAKESGRPVLVVLRCIPCEACHEFDERVAQYDPALADVMERFVRVRITRTNGLDLTRFQFDYDMSWAVFVLHADGTVLARYGSMANRDNPERDITIDGFRRALEGALELHARYPANRQALVGKQGRPTDFATPEEYTSLRDYGEENERTADPVRGCIHCHQLREAQRLVFRDAGLALPDDLMYPFPMPDALGLSLDPKQRARVVAVVADSPAAEAGVKPGDNIVSLAGQPVVSIADVQWALHAADAEAADKEQTALAVVVRRDNRQQRLTLALPAGWRRGDVSWRATTWDLRRMATGGLVLEELTDEQRAARGLPADELALRVKYVGQYGQHAAGRDAGFREDDVIVSFGGHAEPLSESALIALAVDRHRPGDQVAVTVARGNERVELLLPQQ